MTLPDVLPSVTKKHTAMTAKEATSASSKFKKICRLIRIMLLHVYKTTKHRTTELSEAGMSADCNNSCMMKLRETAFAPMIGYATPQISFLADELKNIRNTDQDYFARLINS